MDKCGPDDQGFQSTWRTGGASLGTPETGRMQLTGNAPPTVPIAVQCAIDRGKSFEMIGVNASSEYEESARLWRDMPKPGALDITNAILTEEGEDVGRGAESAVRM
jgi:hypothetical protein